MKTKNESNKEKLHEHQHRIASLSGFLRFVHNCERIRGVGPGDLQLFYRGHNDDAYRLLPSILRAGKGWSSMFDDEYRIVVEATRHPMQWMKGCKNNFERLAYLQHACGPTRLLDITENPLIALFFACWSNLKTNGKVFVFAIDKDKVKGPSNFTPNIISSMAFVKPKFRNNWYRAIKEMRNDKNIGNLQPDERRDYNELIKVIRRDFPNFSPHIRVSQLFSLSFSYVDFVHPRIAAQRGAFIVCPILFKNEDLIEKRIKQFLLSKDATEYPNKSNDRQCEVAIIKAKSKKKILSELSRIGIDAVTIYASLDQFKNQYELR